MFWTGVLIAVLLVVGGGALAYRGYESANAPGAVVGDYFAALAGSDAAAALALGDVPPGTHTLLTATVLRAQQRAAPIRDVSVTGVVRTGSRAKVHVRYLLDWPGAPERVAAVLSVREHSGRWRLDSVAVGTRLALDRAQQRATLAGGPVPNGMVLIFPGAVPVLFDTPYLQVVPRSASVPVQPDTTTYVQVRVSAAGSRAARAAVSAGLLQCFTHRDAVDCPQPSDRYVPGSVHGALPATSPALTVTLASSSAGVLEVTGKVAVVGTHRRLTFANQDVHGKGRVVVLVRAVSYAVEPLRFAWVHP